MARGSRKERRKPAAAHKLSGGSDNNFVLGELTLDDFANSPIKNGKGRLKKAATNPMAREVKQLCSDSDSLLWYEKELDDFDVALNLSGDEEEDLALKERRPRRRKKGAVKKEVSEDEETGVQYPLDIWFLLSEYMRPEDVAKFACICKGTCYVVNSAKFWFGMYKRYYKHVPNIPERLQPECMERPCGLRPCVIRALFYIYSPFVDRLKPVTSFEAEPHNLVKRVCVMMWHQKVKGQWHFFFKMKSPDHKHTFCTSGYPRPPDLLEMLEDVSVNPEEGCRVLQVICQNFISLPIIMGLRLSSVSLNVSAGMRYHCLRLGFSPSHVKTPVQNVVLDPVLNLKVLDWWHPHYPYMIMERGDTSDF